MRKVSAIIQSQAKHEFNKKRKEVIESQLKKSTNNKKQFKENLNLYMSN